MNRVKNVGSIERTIRVIGGALAVIGGFVVLLPTPGSIAAGVLGVALVLLGLDFVFTGARGYCPLYRRLGWSTVRDEGERHDRPVQYPKPTSNPQRSTTMDAEKNVPTGKATHDEQTTEAPERSYSGHLTMPQDDDPMGEGHMWSGKTSVPQEQANEAESQPSDEHGRERTVDKS